MKIAITIVVVVLIAIAIAKNIRIVPQSFAYVIERLGVYSTTWQTGLHIKIPFIERVAKKISLKEQVVDFEPQAVITKDNVTIQIDTVVFYQITDPKLYTYGVENPIVAIENLSATTLRNIIGELELDNTLTSRDTINAKIRVILDEATDAWGIKVNRVELKNIIPPREIQNAMEKQMKAERERRESILRAEGEKQSKILVAEGHKESKILEAEADKQSAILHAEAVKEAKIREAEGEAAAIETVQKASADAIRLLNEANANDAVLKLKALEAFAKVADGQATKIIIPSEIQGMAGGGGGGKEPCHGPKYFGQRQSSLPPPPAGGALRARTPLSLRDISPHCGESPSQRGPRSFVTNGGGGRLISFHCANDARSAAGTQSRGHPWQAGSIG